MASPNLGGADHRTGPHLSQIGHDNKRQEIFPQSRSALRTDSEVIKSPAIIVVGWQIAGCSASVVFSAQCLPGCAWLPSVLSGCFGNDHRNQPSCNRRPLGIDIVSIRKLGVRTVVVSWRWSQPQIVESLSLVGLNRYDRDSADKQRAPPAGFLGLP